MSDTFDFEGEIVRLVDRYYDIADNVVAAAGSGCRMLQANPFSATMSQETSLRAKLAAA